MKRYILFTNEELEDLINGREVKFRTSDNGIVYFMSKEHFAKLFGADDAEEKNVTFPRGLRSKIPGINDDYSRYMEEDDINEKINKALEIAWRFSQIDGSHHKAWTIDQMVRALCGDDNTYKAWIKLYTKSFVDDSGDLDSYSWDEGIAP